LLKRGDLRIITETRTTQPSRAIDWRRRRCFAACAMEQTPSCHDRWPARPGLRVLPRGILGSGSTPGPLAAGKLAVAPHTLPGHGGAV